MNEDQKAKALLAIVEQERVELENAFQAVFSVPEAKLVLAHLYENCHGGKSSFDPNPFVAAHNEGRRVIWLDIMKNSDVEESEMRRTMRSRRLERERKRESLNEQ